MPENNPTRPFDELNWRATIERRLSALEARPQVVAPVALAPAPLSAYPGTDWYSATTSATFLTLWEAQASKWTHTALWAVVPWRTAAGTTGEVRLEASYSTTSNAVSLAANSSGSITFRWLHSQPVWDPSNANAVWVTARRTGGGGSVYVGYPNIAFVDPAGATFAGV